MLPVIVSIWLISVRVTFVNVTSTIALLEVVASSSPPDEPLEHPNDASATNKGAASQTN
jgi:hypothetical protein